MGYKLCMAEKPSVARDIASVIGADKKCKGYYEGNGYRVTWAVGHLVGLAEPEEYGFVSKEAMWRDEKEKAYAELPIIPDNFKLVVLEQTEEQFEIIKELIHRDDTDEIINCGDMGAEGHILQWFIREKAECTKQVRRFCATSMTEEAIRQAMSHLRPEEEFANIIKGEFCKKKADWIMGMSMSRVESLKYKTGINVGRVQSPTLYFVVKRYLEVKNFKVTNYYGIQADLKEGFSVFWNKDTEGIFPPNAKDSEGRVLDGKAVKAKAEAIQEKGIGTVTEIVTKKKGMDRPQLFDITELQREANRKYGYTASTTLATAQALYETQKVLSYPRTDSRYITSDLQPYMESRIKGIGTIAKYKTAVSGLLSKGLNIDKKIVDDSKVTDHHAIIPTEKIKGFDMDSLIPTEEERRKGVTEETLKNVLDLVLCRMIVSFCTPYYYEQTSVKVDLSGMTFTASGKKPLEAGWKGVQETLSGKEREEADAEADAEQIFPDIKKGQTIIRVLPVELYSPKITADWETKIALIAEGKMTEQEFMDSFKVFINDKVQEVKTKDTGIVFKKDRETVGVCPWCGSDLYRYENKDGGKVDSIRYYCSGCNFALDTKNPTVTTVTGKKLTEKQLAKLIAHGNIKLTCKSKKNGTEYKGNFVIIKKEVNGKIYANLDFSPVPFKEKKPVKKAKKLF